MDYGFTICSAVTGTSGFAGVACWQARKSLLQPGECIRCTGHTRFDMAEVADEDPGHARAGGAGSLKVRDR